MLEVRNLTKVYTPKKGVPVRALDGVNIKFEEKGMVFVLGKSGSGKSTFLNLIGGLDTITEGDVVIKGKSSANFSQSDFDSYRNTFIGFIFQEYNILNEFSVGKNIALALELQGKKADKEAVDAILDQVDLSGYANRRPNELSGGQKQRIAIARALIKDPEIIMADEPTGALDSNTGKQVFETLQKLSRTKLVIIVSHDRDYAEFYGDRVIEFADGRIISDIKKYKAQGQTVSAGVSIVDGKILNVKKGHKFSDAEKDAVIRFLENADGDMIVSKDAKSNEDFRRLARIDSDGNKESFENVTPEKQNIKQYDPKQFKLIRSRLPIRHSLKIAGSSLKAKPIRLFLTILLSVVAFGMFGLADTVGVYNKYDATYNSMREAGVDYAAFRKGTGTDWGGIGTVWVSETEMTATDAQSIRTKFPNAQFDELRNPDDYSNWLGGVSSLNYGYNIYQFNKASSEMGMYYTHTDAMSGSANLILGGLMEIKQSGVSGNTYRGYSVTGQFPAQDNEVMISRHVYEAFRTHGFLDYSKWQAPTSEGGGNGTMSNLDSFKIDVQSEEQFLNLFKAPNNLNFVLTQGYSGGISVKVVGIVDTLFPNLYDEYKEAPEEQSGGFDMGTYMKANEIASLFYYGYHGALFIKEGAFDSFKPNRNAQEDKYPGLGSANGVWMGYQTNQGGDSFDFTAASSNIGQNGLTAYFADNRQNKTLAENEVLLSINSAAQYFNNYNWLYDFGSEPADQALIEAKLASVYGTDAQFKDYFVNYMWQRVWATGEWNHALGEYEYTPDYNTIEEVIEAMEEQSGSWEWDPTANGGTGGSVNVPGSVEKFILGWNGWWFDSAALHTDFKQAYLSLITGSYSNEAYDFKPFGLSYEGAKMSIMGNAFISEFFGSVTSFTVQAYMNASQTYENFSMKIVGIAMDTELGLQSNFNNSGVVVDNARYAMLTSFERGDITALLTKLPADRAAQMEMILFSYTDEVIGQNGEGNNLIVRYGLKSSVASAIATVNELIEMFTQIFLYVGIGFAVFAAFLLLNFIMVSISYKKREIGILRAIGAKSGDVFMIFFLESLMIALICFLFAVVGVGIGAYFINQLLLTELGFIITILSFGIRQILLVLAVAVGVAFIATFLPVFNTSRKKPIDAIRKA